MTYYPLRDTSFLTDAGGRTRSSVITTLFDGKTLGADDPLIWETVGTGTGTFSVNKMSMAVTSGQYLIRRGRHVCSYFSGKSQLIEVTMDGFQTEANVVKMAGYYSSSAVSPFNTTYDGFWLENDGTTISLKAHRAGTETANIPWTSWDNYAAISGYDFSDFTVAIFDFLWLGGTELRLFLKTNSGFVLAHTFKWASNNPDTFIQSPNHSVRYEIRSSTGTGSLRAICSQVATEGSLTEAGKSLTVFNGSAITTNAVGTIYALKGLRKVAGYRDTSVQITAASICNTTTSDAGIFMIILNPTLSAPLTWAANSKIEEGTATNQTITAGTGRVLFAGPAGTAGSETGLNNNYLASIGMSAANVSDQLVLAYMPTTTNQSVFGTLTMKEF